MKRLHIVYTSDTHGHVLPADYATGKEKDGGLLCIASKINKDEDTLVLDGGDSLQGTPLIAYYLEHGWPQEADTQPCGKSATDSPDQETADARGMHPVAAAFNAMGLDYYTLGNHDFNFGYEAIRDYVRAMKAVLVCANVEDLGGEIPIRKTAIHTLGNGLKVGLTGAVTDWVNVWEKKEHLTKIKVTDAFASLRQALEELKDKCDVTVCIYHGGYECDLKTGKQLSDSGENIACKIGRELDFDILLTGHQHMAVEQVLFSHPAVGQAADSESDSSWQRAPALGGGRTETVTGCTFSCQCPDQADRYIDLEAAVKDRHTLAEVHSRLLPAGGEPEKNTMKELMPLENAVQKWLDEPAGLFQEAIPPEGKLEAALYGSRVAALFNQVQLEETGAQISCTSLGNDPIGFKKEVSIRDIYAAYPFANTSVVKEITGKVLREALEHCASYFRLENGQPRVSDYFLKPKVEHYNYDFYAGLDYVFDIRKPIGERVVKLAHLNGPAIEADEKLTLVTSDYRATGTGGYDMIGACPAIWTGADNVQDLLVDYIRRHKKLQIPDNVRYKVIW